MYGRARAPFDTPFRSSLVSAAGQRLSAPIPLITMLLDVKHVPPGSHCSPQLVSWRDGLSTRFRACAVVGFTLGLCLGIFSLVYVSLKKKARSHTALQ